jgi:hypothetical protein
VELLTKTSIEVWVRDVQRYAVRIGSSVKEALEVMTQGAARLNVDNMLRDPATAELPDTELADKFVACHMQQAQPKHMQARDKLYSVHGIGWQPAGICNAAQISDHGRCPCVSMFVGYVYRAGH